MLITQSGDIVSLKKDQLVHFQSNGIKHYVDGFIYIGGLRSGEETVKSVHDYFVTNRMIPFKKLYGSFIYLLISDTQTCIFPCDSLLRSVYISDFAVSDSFLELVSYHKANNLPLAFDSESLCDYYSLGGVFFQKTFVQGISILPNSKYIQWKDGNMHILDKGIEDIDGNSGVLDPMKFFSDLGIALQNRRVSISLTGGYDSRMVFALLDKYVNPHLFFSANVKTKDGIVAEKVARVVGKTVDIIKTNKPVLTDEYVVQMIEHSDGMQPLDINSDCRLNNARAQLQLKGIDIQLTGDGGVLHKDWEWMQDLPFYHKKRTDLNKFYHQRIAFSRQAPFCGMKIKSIYEDQESRIVSNMREYVKSINTQSYDALYYYVNGNRNSRYNYVGSKSFTLYAPLNELDLVRYSYHLPRRKRFFYNFIREMTTCADKKIARIPTNYGTTASSEKKYLFRDVFVQIKEYGVKGVRMIKRKLHIDTGGDAVLDWSLEQDLRGLNITRQAVKWSMEYGLLSEDAQPEKIPFRNLMRLIHIFVLHNNYNIG